MNIERRFLQDCRDEGLYYGTVISSPISKGTISTIQLPSSISEDIVFCRTGDIPGKKEITFFDQTVPVLTDGAVEYEGQPLMLLASASENRLKAASKQIHVTYRQEPALPGISMYESEQIIGSKRLTGGDVDSAEHDALHVFENTYKLPYRSRVSPDPEGAFAETLENRIHVYTSTNWAGHVRQSVAAVLSMPENKIIVHPLAFPPSYEEKLLTSSLYAVYAALLAWKSKHAVRILIYPNPRNGTSRASSVIRIKSAISNSGELQALQAAADFECGAFPILPEEILRRNLFQIRSACSCPNFDIRINLIKTNTAPVIPSPTLGSALICTALESEINRFAVMTARSPGVLRLERLQNHTESQERSSRLLTQLIRDSGFERKYGAYEMMKKRRDGGGPEHSPFRGIGIAAAAEGNGFTTPIEGRLSPYVAVRLETEQRITIITSAAVKPGSLAESWKEIAAGILDLPAESVFIDSMGLIQGIDSGPSVLARNIALLTPLVQKCCEAIQKKRFRSPLPIEVKRSARIPKVQTWDEKTGPVFQSTSYGASAVELEFNPVTLEMDILSVWLYADCGSTVNISNTKEVLEAGVLHALTWATGEDVWIRLQGLPSVEKVGFSDIGSAEIHIHVFGDPKRFQPGGAEMLPFSIVPPAFLSALSQAGNMYFDSLPQSPDSIIKRMEER